MTLDQIISQCKKQQELTLSVNCVVVCRMRGKWGKKTTKRLFKGRLPAGVNNPQGRIIAEEAGGTVLVQFKAEELLGACHALKALDVEIEA